MANAIARTSKTLGLIQQELDRTPRLKSDNSKRAYLHDLKAFEDWRDGRPLSKLLVEEYAAHLIGEGKAPNTVNRLLAAVRWWARRMGDLAFEDPTMTKEQREEIGTQAARVAEIGDVGGEREPMGRHISAGELDALMRACAADESPAGVRDAALLGLGWATGARRFELAGLQLSDWLRTGEDEGDLIIRGKGNKTRRAYIYNGAAAALTDWLKIRGEEPGPLFYAINKGGRVLAGHGMSDEALAQMLAKRAAAAGISERMTWHDFRRSFAGNLLDSGADLVTVQKLMGHSSPVTTSAYDRRGDEVKRKAVRALHVPYRRSKGV